MRGFFRHPNAPIFLVCTLLICANWLIWSAVFHAQSRVLRVTFLNIGQGDAIFIEAPGGRQMLIDGGPDQSVLRELAHEMSFFDRTIDVVVATHPDKDHIFGLTSVLNRYDVSYILDPGIPNDTSFWQSFDAAAEGERATRIRARRGMAIHLGGGADFHILFPDRDMEGVSDTNTASIVGKLTFGNTAYMLTGDSPQAIEKYLVQLDASDLKSNVLKAGHHGSRTSSSEEFIEAVHPTYAVISAGKHNSYGHPHQEVIDRLIGSGATILSTYTQGAIRMVSDGALISLK